MRSTRDPGVITGAHEALRSLSLAAPLHPIMVHFTIALTNTSLLFELLGRVLHEPGLAVAGWWTLALSAVATLLTLATGVVSRIALDIGEGEARSYLRLHMALGPAILGMIVAMAIWRGLLWRAGREVGWWYLVALSVATATVAIQGYVGGELVFRWGAGVEGRYRGLRQRRASERPPPLPGATLPSRDVFEQSER